MLKEIALSGRPRVQDAFLLKINSRKFPLALKHYSARYILAKTSKTIA